MVIKEWRETIPELEPLRVRGQNILFAYERGDWLSSPEVIAKLNKLEERSKQFDLWNRVAALATEDFQREAARRVASCDAPAALLTPDECAMLEQIDGLAV